MDRMKRLKNISLLFLLSCIYIGMFFILYSFLHASAVAIISIVFVSYVSWTYGTAAGLTLSLFNFLWNAVTFPMIAPALTKTLNREVIISLGVHIGISFLLGYFGKLAAGLRKEVEVRIQAETLLKKYQNELEERVASRTRELEKANEMLRQAEKMEAIGQLAGGIAHDFSNYLNIILGYSSLLVETLDKQAKENDYAQKIETAAGRASELTTQLLTFARKKKFESQLVNLNDVVKELLPLFSTSVKNTIEIKQIADPGLPMIRGGATQIQNALLNLAVNARDAMGHGGTITFTTQTVEVTPDYCRENGITCPQGRYVGVSVTDTGTGIPPEVLSRMFEPFFTTKEEGKGTGMGLAAVYGIAQSHQGVVFAKTKLGKGTTFTMLFPEAKGNESAASGPAPANPSSAA
jgi:signal transduction histidine kinase